MKKVILIQDTSFYKRGVAYEAVNDILTEIDKEGSELSLLSFGSKNAWTRDIEFMQHLNVGAATQLSSLEIKGAGSMISGTLYLISKEVLKEMKEGFIIVCSEEIKDFYNFLKERAENLNLYKTNREKITELAIERSDEDKLQVERYKQYNQSLKKQLAFGAFFSKFSSTGMLYLLKRGKLITSNSKAGLMVFKLNRSSNGSQFLLKDLDELTRQFESSVIEDSEVEEVIRSQFKPFDSIDTKFFVPIFSHGISLINNEAVQTVDLLAMSKMVSLPAAAPVKASIAASMLASGNGAKLDTEVVLNGEKCLIKSAITPIEINETQFVDGAKEKVKIFTWEPQLGVFNKLNKEFNILK